ncbi:hypothetical protein [Thomasclavelia cocleata]|uniref:hypothetical protein n=1 Tax=Thomasclavelia cocleata TaxID=69824 RepID=UPI00272D7385|nr:hypothetical protein [Thomasclavelia cocleata]
MANSATKAKNKYNSKNYYRFPVTLPIEKKDNLIDFINQKGYKSLNEFVVIAITEKIERDNIKVKDSANEN